LALALSGLFAACSSDPYPLPADPPNARAYGPASVGGAVFTTVLYLEPRPGDRIELLGAEPIGVEPGAEVRFYLSRPVAMPDGTQVIGEQREPLVGAIVETAAGASAGPDNVVGIVAEIVAARPGRFEITSVRLRYRVNGGNERTGEAMDVILTACIDDPAPRTCDEIADE
jgi:hypothetical protein